MITEVATFFTDGCGRCDRFASDDCSARIWAEGVARLRTLCLAAGLQETLRWGHPCYRHAGRNIALIGAFRGDFRLTFLNAALLADRDKLLEKPGPNSQTASVMRFASAKEVAARAPQIAAYLAEAKGFAEAGVQPPKQARSLDLPEELIDALDADSDLAEAFEALTPGRQRSYVIALSSAKKPETRVARIAKFRAPILAGKGAMER
ncbi:hypothetical protein EGN72_05815 [Pseudorhodobacter sp. E13]|uniref:YdeI/OmpD-associated family protein n=1 Tax=Pseudorhodobacter sp. E13 TaxID=2487931 RepID=UPI000F8EF1E9|nr:YdeI/OmpD-associated family protein [Pseudorhodobacter sp. E13]RUS63224.1 hypothetical protein EGN72_05815 [Pseudorhodobacter sp. E13]